MLAVYPLSIQHCCEDHKNNPYTFGEQAYKFMQMHKENLHNDATQRANVSLDELSLQNDLYVMDKLIARMINIQTEIQNDKFLQNDIQLMHDLERMEQHSRRIQGWWTRLNNLDNYLSEDTETTNKVIPIN